MLELTTSQEAASAESSEEVFSWVAPHDTTTDITPKFFNVRQLLSMRMQAGRQVGRYLSNRLSHLLSEVEPACYVEFLSVQSFERLTISKLHTLRKSLDSALFVEISHRLRILDQTLTTSPLC